MDFQRPVPCLLSRSWMKDELVYFASISDLAVLKGYTMCGLSVPVPTGGYALMPVSVPSLQCTFSVRSDQLFDSFGEARVFLQMQLNKEHEKNSNELKRLEKRNYQITSIREALNSKTFAAIQEKKQESQR